MRLVDLLETAKETQDIIVRDDWTLGIVYSMRFNCYVWCNKDGKAIEDEVDYTGYKRVILSPKLLEGENWYLTPNKADRAKKIERIKEIHGKVKTKSYVEQRTEELANKINLNGFVEGYYKLGLAHAYGNVMYMLDQDFDKKEMKKFIMEITKGDTELRCDILGIWGEHMDKNH